MIDKKNVTIVLDGQAGSSGKGKLIGYLARHDDFDVAVSNSMPNSGHTYVGEDGEKIVLQQLPVSIINKRTKIVIGPEAAIDPKILFDEILKYQDLIDDRVVFIDENAVVIKDHHISYEKEHLRSGSTFKGCGAARADKVMRSAELFTNYFKRLMYNELSESEALGYSDQEIQTIRSYICVIDTESVMNNKIDQGKTVLLEGYQGCDLDINFGLGYPNVTSRMCNASQMLANCGISPRFVKDIIMVIRPYPIRISNETDLKDENGNTIYVSSGDYSVSKEISWDEIKRRCGAPDDITISEKTTVTKKTRRVFEMNWDHLNKNIRVNRPDYLMLNFAQYLDWDDYGYTGDYEGLSKTTKTFIQSIERVTGIKVGFVGTGEKNDQILDIRNR